MSGTCMTLVKRVPVALALTLMAASAVYAQPPAVRARAFTDRTAIWVGDRVTYTVEIVCPRGTDVLLDDLSKDKLKLDGFDAIGTDSSQTTAADGTTTHDFRYVLTTFHVDMPAVGVEPFSVRYYLSRPGQRMQDAAPAGEIKIPGVSVALRSTLPDGQETYALRDARVQRSRVWIAAKAKLLGLALVILSLVPAVVLGLALVRGRLRHPERATARRARINHRALLEELRAMDVATEAERRSAYDRISAAVRQHVESVSGVAGPSLTASELEVALAGDGRRLDTPTIVELLASCDAARYAPIDHPTDAQACRDAIARAEAILSAH
jgi:hypothetical protein